MSGPAPVSRGRLNAAGAARRARVSEFVIEARELVRSFPGVKAVDGISFGVEPGTCFGLLGPNGAGKTTTVEMLEGILPPDDGAVHYRGRPIGPDYRERIGIQFQNTALQDFLTVRENLRFFGRLYSRRASIDELVQRCHLQEFLDRDARKLSGGQRQRLLLAVALVNDPDLVFLDEPTTGLDPQARRNFWDLVGDIKRDGKTVILTTHYMEEAYQLCDEIAIVDHGRIIARGSPRALLSAHYDDAVLELPGDAIAEAEQLPFEVLRRRDGMAEIMSDDVNAVIAGLLAAGVSLERLTIRARTLEDLFLELTGRDLRP